MFANTPSKRDNYYNLGKQSIIIPKSTLMFICGGGMLMVQFIRPSVKNQHSLLVTLPEHLESPISTFISVFHCGSLLNIQHLQLISEVRRSASTLLSTSTSLQARINLSL